jgi:riboflavin kinase/FMN adenylyltransferase
MHLIKGRNNLKRFNQPVLTIGMFDGVHLAHRKVIQQVVRRARIIKGTSIVLTFYPHPLKVLKHKDSSPTITSVEHRIDLIRQLGVDVCLLLNFTKEFSQMSAERFIKDILVDGIGIKHLIVGKEFCFGKKRSGSFSLLHRLSKIYRFKISRINPIKVKARTVSSSRIRKLIQSGRITQANKFLGRYFSIYGRVKKGKSRGRILGYPTANICPEQEVLPLAGVYAVWVKFGARFLPGILNIGTRPTFKASQRAGSIIEVHIFKFNNPIYGRRLEVFFVRRIRPEKKFSSRQALLARIEKDLPQAKKILKRTEPFRI